MKIKNVLKIYSLAALVFLFAACDQNEVVPSYQVKGKATTTVASVEVSNDEPVGSESIAFTLKVVNLGSDPLKNIVLKAKVGAADYVIVQTIDEASAAKNTELVHTIDYVVPATSGTEVTFDMVVYSQAEYPLIRRTAITVQ